MSQTLIGSVEDSPKFVLHLQKVGPIYYYCGVAKHCEEASMYGSINVLKIGEEPKMAGMTTSPSPPPPTPTGSTETPKSKNGSKDSSKANTPSTASIDKRVSVAVVGGALLSLVSYFL